MKLKAKILAVAVCAMALCVALVGCAGGGKNGDAAANFQGDWMLSGGQQDGQELDAESIKAMEDMGLYVYIQLNEGGQAVISLFGTNTDGTWEAKDATTVALTFEGDTADAKLEGDELVGRQFAEVQEGHHPRRGRRWYRRDRRCRSGRRVAPRLTADPSTQGAPPGRLFLWSHDPAAAQSGKGGARRVRGRRSYAPAASFRIFLALKVARDFEK